MMQDKKHEYILSGEEVTQQTEQDLVEECRVIGLQLAAFECEIKGSGETEAPDFSSNTDPSLMNDSSFSLSAAENQPKNQQKSRTIQDVR